MEDHSDLQQLVNAAGLNADFCERLLRGDRDAAIKDLCLSEAKRQFVLSVQADTLADFAQVLQDWISQHPTPPPPSFSDDALFPLRRW